jgi:hypothetical protein
MVASTVLQYLQSSCFAASVLPLSVLQPTESTTSTIWTVLKSEILLSDAWDNAHQKIRCNHDTHYFIKNFLLTQYNIVHAAFERDMVLRSIRCTYRKHFYVGFNHAVVPAVALVEWQLSSTWCSIFLLIEQRIRYPLQTNTVFSSWPQLSDWLIQHTEWRRQQRHLLGSHSTRRCNIISRCPSWSFLPLPRRKLLETNNVRCKCQLYPNAKRPTTGCSFSTGHC